MTNPRGGEATNAGSSRLRADAAGFLALERILTSEAQRIFRACHCILVFLDLPFKGFPVFVQQHCGFAPIIT